MLCARSKSRLLATLRACSEPWSLYSERTRSKNSTLREAARTRTYRSPEIEMVLCCGSSTRSRK